MGSNLPSRAWQCHPARYATGTLALLAFGVSACAGPGTPTPLPDDVPLAAPVAPGLAVRLIFGPEADLDLFVTDPSQETVYYGNNPSLAGGRLRQDLRCGAPAPRVESVAYAAARPGRYRVSVDHARRCGGPRGPVPYRVEARIRGQSWQESGEIEPGRFLRVALEFDVPIAVVAPAGDGAEPEAPR